MNVEHKTQTLTKTSVYIFLLLLFNRIQEVKELGELSPQWHRRRCDVIEHCNNLICSYQETLVQLDRHSGEYAKGQCK